jgi:four helix bundle protein
MDNIAEGFGRGSRNEFINSLSIAKGETEELKSQLYRGKDIGYFDDLLFQELYQQADLLVRKIAKFISYLNTSSYKGKKYKERKDPTKYNPKL